MTIAGLIATAGVGIVGMSRLGDRLEAVEQASQAQALALQF